MNKDIVFWLDGPPVCCKGLFDKVAEKWQGNAYYICTGGLDENRALILNDCGENDGTGCAKYYYLEKMSDKEQFMSDFLQQHRTDIHVFNGYKSCSAKYMRQLMRLDRNAHILIWAERPHLAVLSGNPIKRYIFSVAHRINHIMYAKKYSNRVAALLPVGEKGVEAYSKLGWSMNRLFPVLYLPEMAIPETVMENQPTEDCIRFIYLGRFSAEGKGLDLLLDACKLLKNDNYTLELVGGYGDYKEKTMEIIASDPHLCFGGTWPISEACQRLHNYDVCIVPSRLEGWNVTVNEAIMAGIGCIVTEEAVSDEMIAVSGAGIVTKASSASIAEAMDRVMENPELVKRFKDAAYAYRERTTADVCAKYFIDVVMYLFGENRNYVRPIPPWINE